MVKVFDKYNIKNYAAALVVCMSVVFVNKPSFAACELGIPMQATANATLTTVETQITTMGETIKGLAEAKLTWSEESIEMNIARLEKAFVDEIKGLGEKLIEEGLKPYTAQRVSSKLLANVQKSKAIDSDNLQDNKAAQEDLQYDSIGEYKPTNQDGRFESKSIYLKIADKYRRTASVMLTQLLSDIGANKEGYSTGRGPDAFVAKRWEVYQKFCDPTDGKGNNGCEIEESNVDQYKVNLHTTPSKLLFANHTLKLGGEDDESYLLEALKELIFNVTGYTNKESLITDAADSAVGREKMVKAREYLAQSDAVNSLIYSIVGERFPSPVDETLGSPESHPVYKTREALGVTNPSTTPSFYEVRQSFVEELRTPEYYMDLIDVENTIHKKEVYLKAYGLILLGQIIEKQEKISNAYAIETANMLQNNSILEDRGITSSSVADE